MRTLFRRTHKAETSTNGNVVCTCGNPDCPGAMFGPIVSAYQIGPIALAIEEARPDFLEKLKARLEAADSFETSGSQMFTPEMFVNAVSENVNGEAARPAHMVDDREELRRQIAWHSEQVTILEDRLTSMEVPEDVSEIFNCMVDDECYSIIGDPVEYERTEDQLLAIVKVIYDGQPFTVIARATDSDEEGIEKHYVYFHLDDDFGFSLFTAITEARRNAE